MAYFFAWWILMMTYHLLELPEPQFGGLNGNMNEI